jgi:hypothetical protein
MEEALGRAALLAGLLLRDSLILSMLGPSGRQPSA